MSLIATVWEKKNIFRTKKEVSRARRATVRKKIQSKIILDSK